jgi:hypothetical protein
MVYFSSGAFLIKPMALVLREAGVLSLKFAAQSWTEK